MRLKPLIEVEDSYEFWRGETFRFYYNDDGNFYDYMLADLLWEDFMILANITDNNNKRGAVYGGVVSIDKENGKRIVFKKDLKHTLGEDLKNWFLIENS